MRADLGSYRLVTAVGLGPGSDSSERLGASSLDALDEIRNEPRPFDSHACVRDGRASRACTRTAPWSGVAATVMPRRRNRSFPRRGADGARKTVFVLTPRWPAACGPAAVARPPRPPRRRSPGGSPATCSQVGRLSGSTLTRNMMPVILASLEDGEMSVVTPRPPRPTSWRRRSPRSPDRRGAPAPGDGDADTRHSRSWR